MKYIKRITHVSIFMYFMHGAIPEDSGAFQRFLEEPRRARIAQTRVLEHFENLPQRIPEDSGGLGIHKNQYKKT